MFAKYIGINIKKHGVQYLFIIFFEVFLLIAILISNGIYLNSTSEKDYAGYWATFFDFSFKEAVAGEEISDKLKTFAQSIPYEYDYMAVYINPADDDINEKYTTHTLFMFSDYEHMTKHLLKYFVKSISDLPTENEYYKDGKTVLTGSSAGNPVYTSDGVFTPEFTYDDNGNITAFGEKYSVCGKFNGYGIVFFECSMPEKAMVSGLQFQMRDIISEKQIQEIYEMYNDIFVENAGRAQLPEVQGLLEQRANAANILVSVLIIVISVLNIMLVFRFLITSRKKCFAVFRFCGFDKAVCIKYSFAEFMLLSVISSAAAVCVFDWLIKPFMINYYNIFSIAFTFDYYLLILGIYTASAVIMFFIYIAPTLSESVTSELREI